MSFGEPLAVVIPTKDPNAEYLARTIHAVGEQDYPDVEVIVVDSSERPVSVSSGDVSVRVIHRPEMGTGEARREGMRETDATYVAHLDEDAVPLDTDYLSESVRRLQQPGVSAVGSVVFPIRGNLDGQAIALLDRFNPTTLGTHHIVHRRRLCTEGECFSAGQGRGEDITIRRELSQYGRIERMDDQGFLKDLPTLRQIIARDIVVGTITGAVAGVATGWLRDRLGEVGDAVENGMGAGA